MKETNIYGMVSGGYLFDIMDRYAQKLIIDTVNDQTKFALTHGAVCTYQRQCCDSEDIVLSHSEISYDNISKRYHVAVYAESKESGEQYANCTFSFSVKNTIHCNSTKVK